jgi:hypothetical protein
MVTSESFKQLKNLLFIDIETASAQPAYGELGERQQQLWAKKAQKLHPEQEPEASYAQWAALFAEFGKVITVGLGYFFQAPESDEVHFKVKALQSDDEAAMLQEIAAMLQGKKRLRLVAHNGLAFDFPYLGRRMLVHRIPLPYSLDLMAKKPWEVPHIDTLQLWKFGEARNYTSLELLCEALGLPSSKNDLDGSQVSRTYHEAKGLERIAAYCQEDVVATARVFLRLHGLPDLPDEAVHWV